jgi:hypothetical protein
LGTKKEHPAAAGPTSAPSSTEQCDRVADANGAGRRHGCVHTEAAAVVLGDRAQDAEVAGSSSCASVDVTHHTVGLTSAKTTSRPTRTVPLVQSSSTNRPRALGCRCRCSCGSAACRSGRCRPAAGADGRPIRWRVRGRARSRGTSRSSTGSGRASSPASTPASWRIPGRRRKRVAVDACVLVPAGAVLEPHAMAEQS